MEYIKTFISKLAMFENKLIMLDYWNDSLEKNVLIGLNKETGEKLLIKNAEKYTSPINKIYKVSECYIICTESLIYLVSSEIPIHLISFEIPTKHI
jgi:hypothetical protein